MPAGLSAKISLFLYVRSHAQVEYYLNIADATRAANDPAHGGSEQQSASSKAASRR
jgi:hypothetical protein